MKQGNTDKSASSVEVKMMLIMLFHCFHRRLKEDNTAEGHVQINSCTACGQAVTKLNVAANLQ